MCVNAGFVASDWAYLGVLVNWGAPTKSMMLNLKITMISSKNLHESLH